MVRYVFERLNVDGENWIFEGSNSGGLNEKKRLIEFGVVLMVRIRVG